MGKNVAVFVDVANIFYAAKAAGVDIDYVTLLKAATAGRDLVRAYAYTGLDPDNENQRNFHDFLRRHGYKVVSKDIRKYGDGKVKANLDIELVVDMMKTARNLDIAIVISGDGDFAPAIRAVQEMGVRCEVISFRGNTSSDLIEVADLFTEITQVARVEKGSSRSGRRVADDDEDLSMTEVPDKQSEGTGGRGRGRGRGRSRVAEAEPVAAPARSRSRSRVAASAAEPVAAVTSDGTPLVVLPGEKLSRVAAVAPPPAIAAEDDIDEAIDEAEGEPVEGTELGGEEPRRRRRRRGGRGRGRGRAQGGDEAATSVDGGESEAPEGRESRPIVAADEDEEDLGPEEAPAPAKRPVHAFGSVWDSQIGMPTASTTGTPGRPPVADDEDFDEPPIPEYLIAERRQRDGARGGGGGGRGGAGRGARGAYAAALDRERFGGGRGAGVNRFAEPAPRGGRGDDRPRDDRPRDDRPRDDRSRGGRGPNQPRGDRPMPRPPARSGSGDEPWSEVPPEIEAMLRAQLGGRGAAPARPGTPREAPAPHETVAAPLTGPFAAPAPLPEPSEPAAATAARTPRRRTSRAGAPEAATVEATPVEATPVAEAAPKRRSTRTAVPKTRATTAKAPTEAAGSVAEATPKRRTTRKAAPAASDGAAVAPAAEAPPAEAAAPKRRATRKKADAPGA